MTAKRMLSRAKKAKAQGAVGGENAKPRIGSVPRIKRGGGGSILSGDSQREVERLRAKAKEDSARAGDAGTGGLSTAILGGIVRGVSSGRGGRAAGRAMEVLGAAGLPVAAVEAHRGGVKNREADRIEKGLAEPGREDGPRIDGRKSGGRVKSARKA